MRRGAWAEGGQEQHTGKQQTVVGLAAQLEQHPAADVGKEAQAQVPFPPSLASAPGL